MKKNNQVKDSKGNILKEDDWCYFWNDNNVKVRYQFYSLSKRELPYISIDKSDNNDLSWWKHCEKIDKEVSMELETVDERAKRECQELGNLFNKSVDRLAELEKLVLDKLVEQGYIIGSGDWGFKVEINSTWKQKSLNVLLKDKEGIRPIFTITKEKLEQMYDEAEMFFHSDFRE
ncbi:hypothetical protein [Halarcobacter anaerophilus]|uniref:Uncharacterized protein n=1 Tax=Halarcobacter anaerophilus TaxID=877500 RepID=A0A4Q0Y0P0_9BACT|nr:hypothetical protein [Halarcobacter anaerophilus]QDF28961.1 hypothetical protein AANAER_1481 [Halarcobacter anaerophilus]RXJ63596.1 hypothetical protein CRV06_05230 [Halarcobacter anaerophilus]